SRRVSDTEAWPGRLNLTVSDTPAGVRHLVNAGARRLRRPATPGDARASVEHQPQPFDDFVPARGVFLDALGEFLRGGRRRREVLLVQLLAHGLAVDDAGQFAVQAIDDGRGRAGRGQDGVP